MKNASQFSGLYDDLGVGYNLGCLMLDTEAPYSHLDVDPKDEFKPNDPKMSYVNGLCTNWHVTIKYGFLENVRKKHVDQVIEGMELPKTLTVSDFSVFPGYGGNYEYVLAHVSSPLLRAMNKQLHVLPNVDTFVDYMPHVTVGYFRPGWFAEKGGEQLEGSLGLEIDTIGLNYGDTLLGLDKAGTV